MLIRIVLLLLVLLVSAESRAAPAMRQAWASWMHTRPLSTGATALLDDATRRSSIITTLLEELEETDLIVYITDSMPMQAGGPKSYLTFLTEDKGYRYLMIRIDFWRLSPPERIAWLGHELRHALEVAGAREVRDESGLARLYRRIGWESQKDKYETDAARDTGNRVRSEIS